MWNTDVIFALNAHNFAGSEGWHVISRFFLTLIYFSVFLFRKDFLKCLFKRSYPVSRGILSPAH